MFFPITRTQLIMFYVKFWSLIQFYKAGAQKLWSNAFFPNTRAQLRVFHVKFWRLIKVT